VINGVKHRKVTRCFGYERSKIRQGLEQQYLSDSVWIFNTLSINLKVCKRFEMRPFQQNVDFMGLENFAPSLLF
jgi:hypothetical protein